MAFIALILFAVYVPLNYFVWRSGRSTPLTLMMVLVYFYFFHGYVMAVAYFYGVEGRYAYIQDYPYYVAANGVFTLSFLYYCLFGLTYLGILYAVTRSVNPKQTEVTRAPIRFNGWALLAVSWTGACGVAFVYGDLIIRAIQTGQSAYMDYKRDALNLGSVSALAQQMFLLTTTSMALLVTGFVNRRADGGAVEVTMSHPPIQGALTIALGALMFVIAAALGDKTTTIGGIVYAVCLMPTSVLQRPTTIAVGLAMLVGINTINFTRHAEYADAPLSELLFVSFFNLFEHGECVTTFSLYTMMLMDLPLRYGQSFVAIAGNLVPRWIVEDRPTMPYDDFADAVGMVDGTGWGLSYPTDWYWNFGVAGMVMGAAVFALFHSMLWAKARHSGAWQCVFAGIVAVSVQGMREGIFVNPMLYSVLITGFLLFTCAERGPAPGRPRALGAGAKP